MNIDHKKLAQLIKESLESVNRHCTAESYCIGEIEGAQIQITVTVDKPDHMTVSDELTCVTK